MSLSFAYSSYNINSVGEELVVKYKNDGIGALASLTSLTTLNNNDFSYQYFPKVNLCSFTKTNTNTAYGVSLGTFATSDDQQSMEISWAYTYEGNYRRRAWFGLGQ